MVAVHRIHHDGGLWWYVAHVTKHDDRWFSTIWEYTDVDDDITGDGDIVSRVFPDTRIGAEVSVAGGVTAKNYRKVFTRHLAGRGWVIRQGSQPVYSTRRHRYEVALGLPQIIPTTHARTNALAIRVAARLGQVVDASQLGIQTQVCDPDDVARAWTTTTPPTHDGASL